MINQVKRSIIGWIIKNRGNVPIYQLNYYYNKFIDNILGFNFNILSTYLFASETLY